jgi:hypothetical protein
MAFAISKSARNSATDFVTADVITPKRVGLQKALQTSSESVLPLEPDRYDRVAAVPVALPPRRDVYVQTITGLWDDAQQRFLEIGRHLVTAKRDLEHGQFEAMVAADLPFGKSIAWQLRVIAEAVDQRRIQEDELPRSQKAAFKLVKLKDNALTQARRQNLVRRDVTPKEVDKFVGMLLAPAVNESALEFKEAERIALQRRIAVLTHELKEAKQRLAVLESDTSVNVLDGPSERVSDQPTGRRPKD